jgi:AhpD family alkylhydroperoxidase
MKATYPAAELKPAWEEFKAVESKGALDAKTKELIGLAVAAQIPCQYCVYAHTMNAKHDGATDAQIKEAIAAAAMTRKWSTVRWTPKARQPEPLVKV